MTTHRIFLDSGTPAIIARPDGLARRGVIALPDAMGLSSLFIEIAEFLAQRLEANVGVLELFPGRESMPFSDRITTGIRDLDESRILSEAKELADLLMVEPVGMLGVCVGGMFAMRASVTERYDRVASLYGMVHVPDAWQNGNKGDPMHAVRSTPVPILAIAGTSDEFITVGDLDELEIAGADVRRFSGAAHGFAHDPNHRNHDANAAKQVWNVVESFFASDRSSRE